MMDDLDMLGAHSESEVHVGFCINTGTVCHTACKNSATLIFAFTLHVRCVYYVQ